MRFVYTNKHERIIAEGENMKRNRTIARTFEMLELLKKNPNGLTLMQLSNEMDIPKSSASDIVQTLLDIGMIDKTDEELKRYTIGLGLFELGNSYLVNKSVGNISDKYLKELSDELQMTSFIGVLSKDEVVYIKKFEPDASIKTSCVVGSRASIHSTSLGKSLLAFSGEIVQDALLSHMKYTKHTNNTIATEEELRKEMKETIKRGYSIDNNENEDGIFCVGAPIFDHTNRVVASLSVSGLYNGKRNVEFESEKVRNTAKKISRELGYLE